MIDDNGNSSECTQLITIVDTTAPVISSCPVDRVIDCVSDATTMLGSLLATDNCDTNLTLSISATNDNLAAACTSDPRIIEYVYQVEDSCGNSSSCTQTYTIVDNVDPVISCPLDSVVECDASTATNAMGVATATDNCNSAPIISFTDTVLAGACLNASSLERVWTATDACGNSVSCTQTITVVDTTDPVITTCPAAGNLTCIDDLPASDPASLVAIDNCDTNVTVSVSATNDNLAAACVGTPRIVEYVYEVEDNCGNTATCTQTYTIIDNIDPIISCPLDRVVECDSSVATNVLGVATATDNCDSAPLISVSDVLIAGSCADERSIARVWTATDTCGNTASCTQTISIVDTTDPVITFCPSNEAVSCFSEAIAEPGSVLAIDNCSASTFVTVLTTNDNGATGCVSDPRLVEYIYQVSDNCGNTTSCSQTYTIVDIIDPVALCPSDVVIECGSSISTNDLGVVFGVDNCSADPALSFVDTFTPGSCSGEGQIDRVWTVEDACGSSVSCTQIISIRDRTGPSVSCPADVAVLGDSACMSILGDYLSVVSVSDVCDSSPSLVQSPAPGTVLSAGDHTLTFSAEDDCGNTNSCSMTITVLCPVTVETFVWVDLDYDGLRDPGEPVVPGVDVVLYDSISGLPVATNTTDFLGAYSFSGLFPGAYHIVFDLNDLPAGFVPTYQDQGSNDNIDSDAELASGETVTTGFLPSGAIDSTLGMGIILPARIGDYVWYDYNVDGFQDLNDDGVEGVGVTLYHSDGTAAGFTTVTDTNGYYIFDYAPPGNYYVQFDLASLPPDFEATLQDNVFGDDVNDSDADPLTGITANTGFLNGGEENLTLDMGVWRPGKIGDTVWIDINNDGDPGNENIETLGLPGIELLLYAVSGSATNFIRSTTTVIVSGNAGFYEFTDLLPGTYMVEVNPDTLPEGFVLDSRGFQQIVVLGFDGSADADANVALDFGFSPIPTAVTLKSFTAISLDYGVVVKWETATETDNFGFNIYRSLLEDGSDKIQVNDHIILGVGSGTGKRYELLDSDVVDQIGIYYYWLEDIEYDFDREMHGPIKLELHEQNKNADEFVDLERGLQFKELNKEAEDFELLLDGKVVPAFSFGNMLGYYIEQKKYGVVVSARESAYPKRIPDQAAFYKKDIEPRLIELDDEGKATFVANAEENILIFGFMGEPLVIGIDNRGQVFIQNGFLISGEDGDSGLYFGVETETVYEVMDFLSEE